MKLFNYVRKKLFFDTLCPVGIVIAIGFLTTSLNSQIAFASAYDGTWKISRTGIGCTPKSLIRVKIDQNRISGSYRGGTGKHTISGKVTSSGNFSFQAKSPSDLVIFSGAISEKSGTGKWNVKGRNCGGTLRIRK